MRGLAITLLVLASAGVQAQPISAFCTPGRDCRVGRLLVNDGSASRPSITFTADGDVGLYRSGANSLNFATGGTNRWAINSSGNWVGQTTGGSNIISSLTNDTTTSTTVAALVFNCATNVTNGDLCWGFTDSSGTYVASINEQGAIVSGGASAQAAFQMTDGAYIFLNGATQTASIRHTATGIEFRTPNNAIYPVTDNTHAIGTASFRFTNLFLSGDVSLAGNDIVGAGTAQTLNITSDTADTTTSATVAAVTIRPSADIAAGDLILNVENSAGTNMLELEEGSGTGRFGRLEAAVPAAPYTCSTEKTGHMVYVRDTDIGATMGEYCVCTCDGQGTPACAWRQLQAPATDCPYF